MFEEAYPSEESTTAAAAAVFFYVGVRRMHFVIYTCILCLYLLLPLKMLSLRVLHCLRDIAFVCACLSVLTAEEV